ncbi:hypothetical protein J1N35_013476 [Gossypium stocksii]|uniref:Reverse transcriptase n=1 Tax=Gossypium stocksii TaxID=47602 RepID=A0A9D3VSW8_9ROSI|nr:hypothetical protein J1N35_013476 [Gossypium stocksii]
MNDDLMVEFIVEGGRATVFSMPPLKASGMDEFLAAFYQKYWHVVGADITNYYLTILRCEVLLEIINRTNILVIPKVVNSRNMSQFRPISLYKVGKMSSFALELDMSKAYD